MSPPPPAIVTEVAAAWAELAALTPARVALGRSGVSLPTREVLGFGLAHARARDAVHAQLDVAALRTMLEADGLSVVEVRSRAPDRAAYLARPDWGRRLDEPSQVDLAKLASEIGVDLVFVLSDGLSATAVQTHVPPLLRSVLPRLAHLRIASCVIATQARVALADEIGEILRARVAVSLIGERPGLSSPDSLGIYLTAQPRIGRSDAERQCISNIHAAGLGYAQAAVSLCALIASALSTGTSGVAIRGPAVGA